VGINSSSDVDSVRYNSVVMMVPNMMRNAMILVLLRFSSFSMKKFEVDMKLKRSMSHSCVPSWYSFFESGSASITVKIKKVTNPKMYITLN
jgi:hypothetical protein